MEDRKETIKTITGEEKEITVGILSFQKRNDILKSCLKFGVKGKELDVQDVDFFGMMNQVLKATLQGTTIDQLADGEGDRIYDKYFSDMLDSITGGNGSKNSQQTSEEQ